MSSNTAPFTISHHDEIGSWFESPVLRALVGHDIVLVSNDGEHLTGEVLGIGESGTITVRTIEDGDMTIDLMGVTDIFYP